MKQSIHHFILVMFFSFSIKAAEISKNNINAYQIMILKTSPLLENVEIGNFFKHTYVSENKIEGFFCFLYPHLYKDVKSLLCVNKEFLKIFSNPVAATKKMIYTYLEDKEIRSEIFFRCAQTSLNQDHIEIASQKSFVGNFPGSLSFYLRTTGKSCILLGLKITVADSTGKNGLDIVKLLGKEDTHKAAMDTIHKLFDLTSFLSHFIPSTIEIKLSNKLKWKNKSVEKKVQLMAVEKIKYEFAKNYFQKVNTLRDSKSQ